jgi:Salt tolerance down-regulator
MTPVNRKKQKRRQKQAARLAAEQHDHNGGLSKPSPDENRYHKDESDDDGDIYDHDDIDDDDDEPRDDRDSNSGPMTNGNGTAKTSKSKKKKKSKTRSISQTFPDESSTSLSAPSATTGRSQPPLPSLPISQSINKPKDRIWNTSTQEERENIKKFWLELGEDERRALVKVEKDAVLKKMKEQQKHSCSCTVCGRKRTAIEEELEVLYDAYYEELEQYANNNQGTFENGAPIIPPPRLYHHNLHSLDHRHAHTHPHPHPHSHSHSHSHSHHIHHHHHHPSHGRVHEIPEDEDDLEDDYDEEDEEEEPYSDDELDDDSRDERADFFAFGNSLTVKGLITFSFIQIVTKVID